MNLIDKLAKYRDSYGGAKASWQNSTNIYSILPLKDYCKKHIVLKLTSTRCVDITAKVCY